MDRKGLIIGSLGLLSAAYIYSSLSWARYVTKEKRLKAEDEKEYCILCNSYDTEMQGEKHFEQYLSREHEKMHHDIYISSKESMLLNVEVIEYDGPGEDDVDANWWTDDWGPEISRDIDPSNLIYDLPQAYVYEKYSDSPTKALARYDEADMFYYPPRQYKFPIIEVSIPNHNKDYKNNELIITPLMKGV